METWVRLSLAVAHSASAKPIDMQHEEGEISRTKRSHFQQHRATRSAFAGGSCLPPRGRGPRACGGARPPARCRRPAPRSSTGGPRCPHRSISEVACISPSPREEEVACSSPSPREEEEAATSSSSPRRSTTDPGRQRGEGARRRPNLRLPPPVPRGGECGGDGGERRGRDLLDGAPQLLWWRAEQAVGRRASSMRDRFIILRVAAARSIRRSRGDLDLCAAAVFSARRYQIEGTCRRRGG
jgi:hypothetical protein